jgi:hypothetical protein
MIGNKEFDCVEMKNAIQRRLVRRRRGMTTEEYIADVNKSIQDSDSPAARWWKRQQKAYAETDTLHAVNK